MIDLSGQVAVATGAGAGSGRAVVAVLTGAAATVAGADRNHVINE